MDEAREFAERAAPTSAAGSRSTTSAPASARFYYLKHLPLDYLKIDGEFIRKLPRQRDRPARRPGDGRDRAAASASRRSPSSSRTSETLELLRDYGVDYAQGFHVGRPEPAPANGHVTDARGALTGGA